MIIRMTVNDNDFTEVVEKFGSGLRDRLCYAKCDAQNVDELLDFYDCQRKCIIILHKDSETQLNENDISFLIDQIISRWNDYINQSKIKVSTSEYLKKNFEVTISFTYTDEWENGEAVYYFTKKNICISQ